VGADCLTLNPLTATLLGVALLGEPIGLPFIAGGGIVVVGIVVAHGVKEEGRQFGILALVHASPDMVRQDMPTLSVFYGIMIQMYWDDHGPAHFHAYCGEHEVLVAVDDLTVLDGSFPRQQMRLVQDWAREHRQELMENWHRCGAKKPLTKIDPLP
jgi:hypothetical protein